MNVLKYRFLFIFIIFLHTPVVADDYWGLGSWLNSMRTPDFEKIDNIQDRKRAFFDYLLPEVEKQNGKIIKLRGDIQNDRVDEKQLAQMYRFYRLHENATREDLLSSVDVVPTSLVLAQAAYESSWGRSRFAKYYHNFFGLWCFKKGCGVVPLRRNPGDTHEVKKFSSLEKSIEYYLLSINRNAAYKTLRQIRKHKRDNKQIITGIGLAEGLTDYAEIGYDYVETVKDIIADNGLSKYDHYVGL